MWTASTRSAELAQLERFANSKIELESASYPWSRVTKLNGEDEKCDRYLCSDLNHRPPAAHNHHVSNLFSPGTYGSDVLTPLCNSTSADRLSEESPLLRECDSMTLMTARNGQSLRTYRCRICKQEFDNKSDLQKHIKDVHSSDEKCHKCVRCLKSFPSSQQLAQHMLVHTNVRKYPCRFCDKTFKQLSHVQQHQRIHTGDRPYKCVIDNCTKAFRQLSSLQQHLKGHNIPLPKSYLRNMPTSSFTRHDSKKLGSGLTLARPHDLTCQVCEKHCTDEERYMKHIHKYHPEYWRVYSGSRPLTDFIESNKIRRKEKIYACGMCNKRYTHETGYVKHMAVHPSTNPSVRDQLFTCTVCEKLFTKDSYLLRHMEMKMDERHLLALEEMKKSSPMFRVSTTTEPGSILDLANESEQLTKHLASDPALRATMAASYELSRSLSEHCSSNGDTKYAQSFAESFSCGNSMKQNLRQSPNSRSPQNGTDHTQTNGITSSMRSSESSTPGTPDSLSLGCHLMDKNNISDIYLKYGDRGYPFLFNGSMGHDTFSKPLLQNMEFSRARDPYYQNSFYSKSSDSTITRHEEISQRALEDQRRHPFFSPPPFLSQSPAISTSTSILPNLMVPSGPFAQTPIDTTYDAGLIPNRWNF